MTRDRRGPDAALPGECAEWDARPDAFAGTPPMRERLTWVPRRGMQAPVRTEYRYTVTSADGTLVAYHSVMASSPDSAQLRAITRARLLYGQSVLCSVAFPKAATLFIPTNVNQ